MRCRWSDEEGEKSIWRPMNRERDTTRAQSLTHSIRNGGITTDDDRSISLFCVCSVHRIKRESILDDNTRSERIFPPSTTEWMKERKRGNCFHTQKMKKVLLFALWYTLSKSFLSLSLLYILTESDLYSTRHQQGSKRFPPSITEKAAFTTGPLLLLSMLQRQSPSLGKVD